MKRVLMKMKKKRAELVLRQHIGRILTNAGLALPPGQRRQVEDDVLALFQDYSSVPKYARDEAVKRGRKRVLETLESC